MNSAPSTLRFSSGARDSGRVAAECAALLNSRTGNELASLAERGRGFERTRSGA